MKRYECVTYFLFKPTSLCYQIAYFCSNLACKAKHFLSFATKNDNIQFYDDSIKNKFISFAQSSIFETSILKILSIDLIYKQCSFNSFTLSFNSFLKNYFETYGFKREFLEEERLAEAFYYYRLLLLINEQQKFKPISFPRVNELESCLKFILSHLPNYFTNKWSQHVCLNERNCMKAIAIDGNHKIHRLVCCFNDFEFNDQIVCKRSNCL